MAYDYERERGGSECIKLAQRSGADVGFGAILMKNGRILGRGWNRRSTPEERAALSHVDYAIHAEQAAVLDALSRNHNVEESIIFVLGVALRGPEKGKLTVRDEITFICRKCPPSVLIPYNISVCIPHTDGWAKLNPNEALATGQELGHTGHWKRFVSEKA